jgi:hypothetical protein
MRALDQTPTSYARFRKLFTLKVEDAETSGGDWDEVLRNTRINRACASNDTLYEPARQNPFRPIVLATLRRMGRSATLMGDLI